MLLVVEVPEQTHTVEFIIGVCIVQLLQELQLFKAGLLPTRTQLHFNSQRLIDIPVFEGLKHDITITLHPWRNIDKKKNKKISTSMTIQYKHISSAMCYFKRHWSGLLIYSKRS